ncbi:MAG: hypothetical protein K9N62_03270 [Verrucomicrobia bacterium]|nr:hypothetical protein [Verrucomicrobiota bacterium]
MKRKATHLQESTLLAVHHNIARAPGWIMAILFLCFLAALPVCDRLLPSISAATPEENVPAARTVNQGTEVLKQWSPDQHLYIKGELGVGATQLSDLERWLRENAPNWTIVLLENAAGELFTDAEGGRHSGMDAVEHALGKGLPNQTAFGQLTDPRTGERNGAFFILFLQERKFSYYGSDAQDRRGLGEDRWDERLDQPAVAAMRSGGRIADAVKDTVSSIDRQLSQHIANEEKQRKQKEAEALSVRQRALDLATASLENGTAAVNQLENKLRSLLEEHADLSGEIAHPNLAQMRVDLAAARAALDDDNPKAARSLAEQVRAQAQSATLSIEDYRQAESEFTVMERHLREASSARYAGIAEQVLSEARAALTQARQAHERAEPAYQNHLETTGQKLQKAQAQIQFAERAAARQRQYMRIGSASGAALLLLIGVALNLRRRRSREEALALCEAWSKALNEKASALVELLEKTRILLGASKDEVSGRFSGTTLELGRQVVCDVDELFIMSSCAGHIHHDAEALVRPERLARRAFNLFAGANYQKTIRRLRDEPVEFRPEQRLELLLRGPRGKHAALLGNLESYQPFKLSFSELIDAFNHRASRAVETLGRIESSLSAVGSTLHLIERNLQSARAQEALLQVPPGSDRSFVGAPIFAVLLPSAERDLTDAQARAVTDPVGALEGQAESARQKVDDAQALTRIASRYHAESRGELTEAVEQLKGGGLQTAWIDQAVLQLSNRADALAEQAMKESIAEPAAELNEDLSRLIARTRETIALNQMRCEVGLKSVQDTDAVIASARKDLAGSLGKTPDAILREPGCDPSEHMATAREQLTAVKASLDRGGVDAARDGLEAVAELVREAESLVKSTRAAFEEHSATLRERQQRTESLEKELPSHEQILVEIESTYVGSVLELGAGDPTHPHANGTIQDNLKEVREHLTSVRELTRIAVEDHREARFLQASRRLSQAAALQDQIRFRLDEIVEKRQRIQQVEAANEQLEGVLNQRIGELEPSLKDARTTRPTIEVFEGARIRFDGARRRRAATPRDPFTVAAELAAVQETVLQIGDQIRCDWEAYAETNRSLQTAVAQLEVARRLDRDAATDSLPDSGPILQASRDLQDLLHLSARVQSDLAEPHNNWMQLDAEADRITTEACRISSVLRHELQAAQTALAALSAAGHRVRSATGWTGGFGVTLLGAPGSQQLNHARALLGDGHYEQARIHAEAARHAAETAIAQAEAEVLRRRREEQARLEQERRRREEAERRRISIQNSGGSGSGFGHSSFTSHSGTSRSSFSSGSGVNRSGW